jgi:hypothetical protein
LTRYRIVGCVFWKKVWNRFHSMSSGLHSFSKENVILIFVPLYVYVSLFSGCLFQIFSYVWILKVYCDTSRLFIYSLIYLIKLFLIFSGFLVYVLLEFSPCLENSFIHSSHISSTLSSLLVLDLYCYSNKLPEI